MLLLAEEDRPAFSEPWLRECPVLAGGAMSTTMPTALLGNEGRDKVGDRLLPLMQDSGLEAELEEI